MRHSLDPGPWPLSRWLLTLLAALVVHAAPLLLLSNPEPIHDNRPTPARPVILDELRETGSRERSLRIGRDPSLLTRVHARGFTGDLWQDAVMSSREYVEWSEPHRFLNQDQFRAGAAFREFALTQEVSPSIVSRAHPTLSSAELPKPIPPATSSILVDGRIRHRLPDSVASLPSWPHTNLVRPTVITVAIDRFGWAQSSLILSNSLPRADEFALQWIRKTQFKTLPPNRLEIDSRLTWGEITFRWVTTASTNSPGQPPSP